MSTLSEGGSSAYDRPGASAQDAVCILSDVNINSVSINNKKEGVSAQVDDGIIGNVNINSIIII